MRRLLLPLLVFLASFALTLYNLNNFPKFIGDEGIYVSQAYSLTTLGELGPYTYWYDHSPLGWLQIGMWQRLVGVTSFWGSSILTSRVLMALILSATTTLLYMLASCLSRSRLIGLLATVIYGLSALTQTFGRMVLLDNFAIFWLLLSLNLLIYYPDKLKLTIFSAASFAVAILTKESFLFFIPPYFLLLNHLTRSFPTRRYSLLTSTITLVFILSFFPLLAILKNELLPKAGQVSLVETILFQLNRGSQLPFYQVGSHFREMLSVWLKIDPILFIGGSSSLVFIILKPSTRYLAFFTLFYLFFLIRGGQIYDFYVIPLLPFLALNLALAIHTSTNKLRNLFCGLALTSYICYAILGASYPWNSQATYNQLEAINYLKKNSTELAIAAPDYSYLDVKIHNPNTNIHWYKKLDSDPAINTIKPDLALIDNQFKRELESGDLNNLQTNLADSTLVKEFGTPLAPGLNPPPYTHEHLTLNSAIKETRNATYQQITSYTSAIASPDQEYAAILINRRDFTNSSDLQNIISTIKANRNTQLILVTQDSEGSNDIPWINTNSRSFFKSSEEANVATEKKVVALGQLGVTGAIIATSYNDDGLLQTIVDAAIPHLTPFVRFDGQNIPEEKVNLVVTNPTDLNKIKATNYQGKLYLLN